MDNIKNDDFYLTKIKTYLDRIIELMKDSDYDMYYKDLSLQEQTMFNLIQISENARLISEDFKNKNKSIPWIDIYGLRNRIVHDYGNVVLTIVYDTLTKDIPVIYEQLFKNKG